jgi:hypothetical protein
MVLLDFLWPVIIAVHAQCKEVPGDYPICVVLNLPEKVTIANVRGEKIMYEKWRHAVAGDHFTTYCMMSASYKRYAGVVLNGRLGKNNKKLIAYVLLYCDVHSTLAYEHLRKMVNKRFVVARL